MRTTKPSICSTALRPGLCPWEGRGPRPTSPQQVHYTLAPGDATVPRRLHHSLTRYVDFRLTSNEGAHAGALSAPQPSNDKSCENNHHPGRAGISIHLTAKKHCTGAIPSSNGRGTERPRRSQTSKRRVLGSTVCSFSRAQETGTPSTSCHFNGTFDLHRATTLPCKPQGGRAFNK